MMLATTRGRTALMAAGFTLALATLPVAGASCAQPADDDGAAAGSAAQSESGAPVLATSLLADHADLDPVRDTLQTRISEVLLLGGSRSIVPLQAELMKALPDATFYVVPARGNGLDEAVYRQAMTTAGVPAGASVHFADFGRSLTDWTQDRLVRFRHAKSGKSVVLPVKADSLQMNEWAPFEIGVPRALEQQYPATFARFEHARYYDDWVVDAQTGEMYAYSQSYANWFRGSVWNMTYGDGGDRIATESTLFIGAPTHAQMIATLQRRVPTLGGGVTSYDELIARLFKVRQVVPVGDPDLAKTYLFHIDVFMTAFEDGGKTHVILGSPRSMLADVFGATSLAELPAWMNHDAPSWERRVASFDKIKADLVARGFEVTEIPILFTDLSSGSTSKTPVLSFNNGLLTRTGAAGKTFLSVDFGFGHPELDAAIARARGVVKQRLAAIGLDVVFLPGGQNSAENGGLLRCTAGVIGRQ